MSSGYLSKLISNVRKPMKPYELMKGGIHRNIKLPYTDSIELYHNISSSCSQKVRLCLEYNNIRK